MTMESRLLSIARADAGYVAQRNLEYGESWCKRGGQQAFAVIWRKVDRIESIMEKMNNGYDIFAAWRENPGNVRDDILDLRQYLLLLQEYLERKDLPYDGKRALELNARTPTASFIDSGVPQGKGYVDQDRGQR